MAGIRGLSGWFGTVLGTPDPAGLARFYGALLGLEVNEGDDDGFVTLRLGGTHYLACQLEADHVPPAWPSGPGDQQMQVHLDIGVTGLAEAVADAEALGARQAAFQPQDDVRVMLDPAGHPFCLYTDT